MKKKNMENGKKRTRLVYAVPCTEFHKAEPCLILAGTTEFSGGAGEGELDVIAGAKTNILGREFEFSDVWEE